VREEEEEEEEEEERYARWSTLDNSFWQIGSQAGKNITLDIRH
jgi:hypothetical protein